MSSVCRPVAKNFQVGVLSLRVLGPGKSEARRVDGDRGSWGGVYPSAPDTGSGECCMLPQQGLKMRLGRPAKIEIFCILALKYLVSAWWHQFY